MGRRDRERCQKCKAFDPQTGWVVDLPEAKQEELRYLTNCTRLCPACIERLIREHYEELDREASYHDD